MNLATWSLRNPSAAILIFILLTFAGLWGFHKLNVQDFPDMEFPMVSVSLSQPGAVPAQLETEVARKAEDALSNLQLLRHINTTVSRGNVSNPTKPGHLIERCDDYRVASQCFVDRKG